MSSYRPRRSMLFMPGSNARALEKAKALDCDGVIFDLEDAVSPAEKESARELVAEALLGGDYGRRERIVRINGLDTSWWRDDLRRLAVLKPDAVLVPKIESAAMIEEVAAELFKIGETDIPLWAMLETPRAYLRAEEIALSTSDHLRCFVVGTNDLVKELRGAHSRGRLPVITALGTAVLVARAYGLTVLDGVFNDFRDTDAFTQECEQGREFGFDGKTLIHPAQIDPANQVFGVSEEEVEAAQKLVAAFETAAADGKGVAVLDGRMIEELHVKEARRTLAMAEAIAAAEQ